MKARPKQCFKSIIVFGVFFLFLLVALWSFYYQQSPQLFQSLQPKADNSKESLLSTWSNASDKIDRHHEQQQLLNLETGSSPKILSTPTGYSCVILLWAHVNAKNLIVPKRPLCGGGCELTYDRKRFDEASAVIFMMKRLSLKDLPKPSKRKRDQVFIWFSRETPWTSKYFYRLNLADFNGYFNWTMTYRLDSDVDAAMMPFSARPFMSYLYKWKYENDLPIFENDEIFSDLRRYMLDVGVQYCEEYVEKVSMPDLAKKTRLVVWKATNCDTTKGAKTRADIVKKLISLGLEVDGDSKCLGKKASKKKMYSSMQDLFDTVSTYKFYLSFENSYYCKEYITEKVWYNSFYAGTVPIVWGETKKAYERLLPPKSFIHYEDYSTPQDLIGYIKYLDKNNTAYMKYFDWRKSFPCSYPLYKHNDTVEYESAIVDQYSSFQNAYCSLCKMLKDGLHLNTSKTILNLNNYWENTERSKCLS